MPDLPKHRFIPWSYNQDLCGWSQDGQICKSYEVNYVAHWQPDETIPPEPSASDRPTMPATPELDRMSDVTSKSQPIGEFLEWLQAEKGYVIAEYHDGWERPWPVSFSIEELLAEHFKIDLKKVEEERRAMLDYIRARNASTSDGAS